MPIKLDEHAAEQGTYVIVLTFTDEDGAGNAPTAIAWTLSDPDGNIINARSAVTVASPATSNAITLAGTDLAIVAGQRNERLFLVKWTYNSTYGSGRTSYEQATFIIDDLKKVS